MNNSLDGLLGIRTRGGKMVGTDESTGPSILILLPWATCEMNQLTRTKDTNRIYSLCLALCLGPLVQRSSIVTEVGFEPTLNDFGQGNSLSRSPP